MLFWVAPLVGARIEISKGVDIDVEAIVAPLVGARIEIAVGYGVRTVLTVAPLVGARIEILAPSFFDTPDTGRSPRGSED